MSTKPLERGSLSVIENGAVTMVYNFQFNPTERSISHNTNWNLISPPGSALPIASFQNIDGPVFSLTVLLDATENYSSDEQGVRAAKAFFESLVQPSYSQYIEALGTFTSPPEVRYTMGGESFEVLVTKVGFRDVRFNRIGFETRTYVDLEMTMYMKNPSLLKARLERLKNLRQKVIVRSEQ
jgi:hypothetical protein